MRNTIAYLNHWTGDGPAALTGGAAPRAACVPLYGLHELPLADYRALLVPAHADQRYLLEQRARLEAYLESGGTVVFNGHVAYPFLRWLAPFVPGSAAGVAGLRVNRAAPHPVFDGVDPEHLTFRRGVAGFYARGSNPPPAGARVLNTLGPDAQPIDWVLALPGGGRLLTHSGNDLWMYAGSADSAGRIVPQLFDWLHGDAA
ncbi:hypothetical protein AVE30378_05447 [Achromobacter veterisilvae]|uniref:ThuA-like domain-containing protein n=1 Tax=Achromobacter veterisilvae TaxID=2069367 RepID=A0A446CYS8_9BURK|nr:MULTISPECIES: hypothetical protein [Achromobacter]MCW0205787.1 hypothetical protein [Achromobacter sp.]SSW73000.1 hypothetical protein AVE30378_05447 [Achromobacter veterisilvae]